MGEISSLGNFCSFVSRVLVVARFHVIVIVKKKKKKEWKILYEHLTTI